MEISLKYCANAQRRRAKAGNKSQHKLLLSEGQKERLQSSLDCAADEGCPSLSRSDRNNNSARVRASSTARRAQESVGFIITVGSALMLFMLFSGIISDNTSSAVNARTLFKARTANEKLAGAVFRAFMNGPGSEENVTLEQLEENYTIYVKPGNVILVYALGSHTDSTNAYKVIESQVTYGRVSVKNTEGWINVTQI